MAGSPLGATPTHPTPGHQAATEAAILQAMPHDLAQVLTGALLRHLQGPATYERWCLKAAHDALADAGNTTAALGYVRAGLAQAIRPDHITPSPETILLQAVLWLLATEAQAFELVASAASASRFGGAAA
jgi:hypothetical protein